MLISANIKNSRKTVFTLTKINDLLLNFPRNISSCPECSWNCREIYKKAPVSEYSFSKVLVLRKSRHSWFPVNFAKFLRTYFLYSSEINQVQLRRLRFSEITMMLSKNDDAKRVFEIPPNSYCKAFTRKYFTASPISDCTENEFFIKDFFSKCDQIRVKFTFKIFLFFANVYVLLDYDFE